MYAIIFLILAGIFYLDDNPLEKEVSYSQFEKYVEGGGITKIVVLSNKDIAEGYMTDSLAKKVFHETQLKSGQKNATKLVTEIPSASKFQDKIDMWNNSGVFNGEVSYQKSSDFSSILWTFGPVILLILFWFFIMKRMSGKDGGAGGVFSVGKSKAQIFDKDGPI